MIDAKPSSSGADGRGCVGSGKLDEIHVEQDALRLSVLDARLHLVTRHAAVEGRTVRELEFGVLLAIRLSRRRSEDASRSERHAWNLLAELAVVAVPLCVGRPLPENNCLDHVSPLSPWAERIASAGCRGKEIEWRESSS